MIRRGNIRIGTSGWIYAHWRGGVFYPDPLPVREWFGYYTRFFDTVEINNTFYRLPAANVFDAWRNQAPPRFLYAVKASRFLTHMKKLKDPAEPLENILGRARRLGPFLGPVLYQLPPRWRCDLERLTQFLQHLPNDLRHVLEFRDRSWYCDAVRQLLSQAGVSFCMHDMKGETCPDWVTGPVVYIRFHGSIAEHTGRYALDHLRAWARRIEAYCARGADVFVYFNNDSRGNAVINARELQQLCQVAPAAAIPN